MSFAFLYSTPRTWPKEGECIGEREEEFLIWKYMFCGIPDELRICDPNTYEECSRHFFFRFIRQMNVARFRTERERSFSTFWKPQRHVVLPRHPDFMIIIIEIFFPRFVRAFAGFKNNSHGIKVKIKFNVRFLLCSFIAWVASQ